MQWFHNQWAQYEEKAAWILKAEEIVRELWLEDKGKSFLLLPPLFTLVTLQLLVIRDKIYTFAWAHKHLKITHPECNGLVLINRFKKYLTINRVLFTKN